MPISIIMCECLVVACEQVLFTDKLLLAKVDLTEAFQCQIQTADTGLFCSSKPGYAAKDIMNYLTEQMPFIGLILWNGCLKYYPF